MGDWGYNPSYKGTYNFQLVGTHLAPPCEKSLNLEPECFGAFFWGHPDPTRGRVWSLEFFQNYMFFILIPTVDIQVLPEKVFLDPKT